MSGHVWRGFMLTSALMVCCPQARLLQEDPLAWQSILEDWESLLPDTLSRWKEDDGKLAAVFEEHR